MLSEILIRKIADTDFPTIYKFINDLEETEYDKNEMYNAFIKNILNIDNFYLIAEINNIPVGYLSCHCQYLLHHGGNKIGEIQEMYVTAENRKLGIGNKLLNELKKMCINYNVKQIEVTSNIIREDTHRFYQREGFILTHKKFVFSV